MLLSHSFHPLFPPPAPIFAPPLAHCRNTSIQAPFYLYSPPQRVSNSSSTSSFCKQHLSFPPLPPFPQCLVVQRADRERVLGAAADPRLRRLGGRVSGGGGVWGLPVFVRVLRSLRPRRPRRAARVPVPAAGLYDTRSQVGGGGEARTSLPYGTEQNGRKKKLKVFDRATEEGRKWACTALRSMK